MHIYDLKALDDAWRPLPSSGRHITSQSAIYIETYPHAVLRLPTDDPHIEMTMARTSVHENPVKTGTYKLVMHIADEDERMFWYTCFATTNTQDGHPTLKYVSSGRAWNGLQRVRQTSYAGYVLDDANWLGDPKSPGGTAVHLGRAERSDPVNDSLQADLSKYSGVITRVTRGGVVLSYYS